MTGAEFAAYVLSIFKRTDKTTEVYEAITDAVMDMKRDFEFDSIKTEMDTTDTITVLGDYKLNAETNLGLIIGDVLLRNGNSSYHLTKLTKEEYDRIYPNQSAAGVTKGMPDHWCFFAGQILLGPVPGSTSYTYHISFTANDGAAIVAGTTAVPFTTVKEPRRALRHKTLEYLFDLVQNEEMARKHGSLYEREMPLIIRKEKRNSGAPAFTAYNKF